MGVINLFCKWRSYITKPCNLPKVTQEKGGCTPVYHPLMYTLIHPASMEGVALAMIINKINPFKKKKNWFFRFKYTY